MSVTKKVSQVLNPGEFSRRGDIVDIYEMTADYPYRLEFFGDEVDGIRQFDAETQKSLSNIEQVTIPQLMSSFYRKKILLELVRHLRRF